MANFAKTTFSHAAYASFRPEYPPRLYDTILNFHKGSHNLLVDLGTGHGLVARYLSKYFDHVVATDPSAGMIAQARSLTPPIQYPNITFEACTAENLTFAADKSIDMVVAGQAAHWFSYPALFAELSRVMKPNGSLAFWGYQDHVFVDYPGATALLHELACGTRADQLGPYWQQPGRSIVQERLLPIEPPESEWEVQRLVYEPGTGGKGSGTGTSFIERRMTVAANMEYVRTWSAYHGWEETHPERVKRSAGGVGDCVDELFDRIREAEEDLRDDPDFLKREVEVEWGFGVVMARRRKPE